MIRRMTAAVAAVWLGAGAAGALELSEPPDFGAAPAALGGPIHDLDPGTNLFDGRLQGQGEIPLDADVISFSLARAGRIEAIRLYLLEGASATFERMTIEARLTCDHGRGFVQVAQPLDALGGPGVVEFVPGALAAYAARYPTATEAYVRIGLGKGSGHLRKVPGRPTVEYDFPYRLEIVVRGP